MEYRAINFSQKFGLFKEQWQPKVVAEMNHCTLMIRPGLVIFDCDGVLVDSEPIDARIRSECLRAAGFPIIAQELADHPGISGANLIAMIEGRFGRPLPEDFMRTTRAKIMSAFREDHECVQGRIDSH